MNFRVQSQFEIKILIVQLINTTYYLCIEKKIEFESANYLKTSKFSRTLDARDTVNWYWSADTLFWQLSTDHDMDVLYQVAGSQTSWKVRFNIGFLVVQTEGRSRDYQIFSGT